MVAIETNTHYISFCRWRIQPNQRCGKIRPITRKAYVPSRPVRIGVVQYQMRPVNDWGEFAQQCDIPIGSSVDRGEHLADLVMERCRLSC